MKLSQAEYDLIVSILRTSTLSVGASESGTVIYGDSNAVTGVDYAQIAIREDGTAFTSLVCSDGTHTKGASDFYKTGATALKGDVLIPPPGYRFKSFELSSGSITCA